MHYLRNLQWLLILSLVASLSLIGCAARPELKVTHMQQASVGTPSKDKSFWRDTVTYPFPVSYAKAKDARGIEWEVAYMDEYIGQDKAKAKTLVLVHGKGADSGYWSALMKDALEAGLRVVAFDIPHYGKSIPGNLDKPMARTMADTRVALHEILVNQLGIKKATYLGHSLGAHWVLGFALDYPQAVEKLVLEDSGAFERYPRMLKLPQGELAWLDPAMAYDYDKWNQTWAFTGRLDAERKRTEEFIRLFNYFKKKDPKSGEIVESNLGFFKNNTPDAQYQTDVRVGMINGPKAEYESWIIAYTRDIYAQGIELLKDDPNSIPARLSEIKVPVFIVYGSEEPFLPATIVTGNTDIRLDLIKPAAEALAKNGPVPVVKFYAGAGHFPHTDFPELFNKDVINFVYGDPIEGTEDPTRYKKSAVKLPADIAAFIAEDIAAVKSADLDRIMAQYHKDFKSDGRDYAATRGIFLQYAEQLKAKWEIEITDLKIDGNIAEIDGSLANPYVKASLKGTQLIKQDGRWLWYGNRK